MSTPTRWRDDPAFRLESGIDLQGDDAALVRWNVDTVRKAVARRLWWRTVWAGSIGATLVGGGLVAAVQLWSVPNEASVPSAVGSPPNASAEIQRPMPPKPDRSPLAAPDAPKVPVVAVALPVERRSHALPVHAEVVAPAPQADVDGSPDEIAAPAAPAVAKTSSSTAREEIDAFEAANSLLEQGRVGEALGSFEDWTERFPRASLGTEASVGRLDCLIRLGRSVEAEGLAADLLKDAQGTAFGSALIRLRATALVGLDRCDEALGLVEASDRETASAIRAACRGKR